MLFIYCILSFVIYCGHASVDVSRCLPVEIVKWDQYELEDHVQDCLLTNFKWKATTLLSGYVLSYIEAYTRMETVEEKENDLFYNRHALMSALRDTKLKATHHIHALKKCAENGMPVTLMDAYSSDDNLMATRIELWSHHVKQDFDECKRVLLDIARHKHLEMMTRNYNMNGVYQNSLKDADDARLSAESAIESANAAREKLLVDIN